MVGYTPSVCRCCCYLKKIQNAPRPPEHSPVREKMPHSAYWLPTRKKHFTRCGQSRSWSAEQGKENKKEELWQHTSPPLHPPHCSYGGKKTTTTRRIFRHYAGLGRSRVRTRISSARRLATRPMDVASQNSTLPSVITSLCVCIY